MPRMTSSLPLPCLLLIIQVYLLLLCLSASTTGAALTNAPRTQLRGRLPAARGGVRGAARGAVPIPLHTLTNSSTSLSVEEQQQKQELFCREMVDVNKCRPGEGWGKMNTMQIRRWKKVRCDQYFCKPNVMEARGSYKCEPLDPQTQTQIQTPLAAK